MDLWEVRNLRKVLAQLEVVAVVASLPLAKGLRRVTVRMPKL